MIVLPEDDDKDEARKAEAVADRDASLAPADEPADASAPTSGEPIADALEATLPPTDPSPADSSINDLKEKIMSTNPTADFTANLNGATSDIQHRSQAALDKSTELLAGASDAAKGNVEAMVESGKIFSTGMQDLARSYVEEAKAAYEQMTADLKEMAAVKSPTELLQLQGKILRRNFDTLVATNSKGAEKMMKLSNDSFAPISARLSIVGDKVGKLD